MTKSHHPIMALILLFHILIATALAGRDIPNTNLKRRDDGVRHPESFIIHDRGYLVPGVGRGIKPKCKDGFNPFTYNPVTGGNDGGIGGHVVPRFGRGGGGGGGGGGQYVPGGDDTFVPNPGFEVPSPGVGSRAPGPVSN